MKLEDILSLVLQNSHSAFFYTPPFYKKSNSYLLTNPVNIISVSARDNIKEKLNFIDELIQKGKPGFSLLNYEAGYLFEPKLLKFLNDNDNPLIKFYFFDEKHLKSFKPGEIDQRQFSLNDFKISGFNLNTSKKEYSSSLKKIKNYIEEGDTYQVNYTVKGKFNFAGDLIELFKALTYNQSAQYTAFINNGEEIIISLSPELFFKVKGRKIFSKPMKGTARRGIDNPSDSLIKYALESSEKNKAENLMIVDLIRNDLGRISEFNSINVKNIFEVEKYESLFQMVSTVKGELKKGIQLSDVIANMFPCGSITGAPKIRTMEIIKEIEKEERGIYTGAVGLLKKDEITFNVPIRTLVINKNSGKGEIGLGSGIVWDSAAGDEYEETLLKSSFIKKPKPYFELIETMLVKNGNIFLLNEHLQRLKSSASFFLFMYDDLKAQKKILREIKNLDKSKKYKLRLLLNKWGKIKIESFEEKELQEEIKIIISKKTISSQSQFQYFKTTNRKLYDSELLKAKRKGFFDVIFVNEKNQITEGAVTNIFLKKGGMTYTPPVESGILPGIYRKYLLQNNINIKEEAVYKDDLLAADEVFLTNAVKGKVKVNKIYFDEKEFQLLSSYGKDTFGRNTAESFLA